MSLRWLVVAFLVVALSACASVADDSSFSEEPMSNGGAAADVAPAPAAEDAGSAGLASPVVSDVPVGVKVIRDGRVDVRVAPGSFGPAAQRVRAMASDLGGYVSASETGLERVDGADYTSGWLTVRIPSDRFDDALASVDGLGDRISLNVSSQDVTEEYVDLESRLRYWRQQEEFYGKLLDEASEVDDLVKIQDQMREVLLTIEQVEGRMRYLESRTEFSTLTVGITEVPAAPEPPPDHGVIAAALTQSWATLQMTVAGLIILAGFAIPFAVLAGLAVSVAVIVRRRFHATTRPGTSATPPESIDD